jgi:PAS domain S-box-containing protein
MKEAPLPENEEARLASLYQYKILDTEPEQSFDELTRLAAYICGTPIALVSLVDANRQWFKSKVGLNALETPRSVAFCTHALLEPQQVFIVPDSHADERFADNPLVTSDPNVRFYAGVPLTTADGNSLGTLCVIDHVPRDLKPEQVEALRDLGRQVIRQMELRRNLAEMASTNGQQEQGAKIGKLFFKKMALGMGVATVLMILMGVVSYQNTTQILESNNLDINSLPVIKYLHSTLAKVEEAQTEQREYLLTQKEPDLVAYKNTTKEIYQNLANLKEIKQNTQYQHDLNILQKEIDIKINELDETIKLQQQEGIQATLLKLSNRTKDVAMNDIRNFIDAIETKQNQLIAERNKQAKTNAYNVLKIVFGGIFVNIFIFAGVAYITSLQTAEGNQVKETLEKERNFISTVLETAGALVVVFDLDGRIIRFNRACEETTGYSFNEVRGKILWNIFLAPEQVEPVKAAFNPILKGNSINKCKIEHYWITRDGSRRLISWSNTILIDNQESVKYIISTGIDITERQKAEENIRAMQNQIVIQEKLASLGSLTAGIAHEIKNPLNFVNNFAELSGDLTEELIEEINNQKNRLEPQVSEYITEVLKDLQQNVFKINEHGQRADKIINNMLLHASGGEGNWSTININILLAECLNLAYHGMRGNDPNFNVTIETDYDNSIESLQLVQQDLSRAFINIISNAFYAISEEKIRLGERNGFVPRISVQTKNLGDRIEICIQDNGNGIKQEVLDKIFNPFFTTKPAGEGTGLGLSLTHDIIVQQHQGEIKVETAEESYTKFIIILPKLNNFSTLNGSAKPTLIS